MSTPTITQICIVGGGNASQVMATLLSSKDARLDANIRVTVFAPFSNEAERLNESDGITLENPDGSSYFGKAHAISKDAKDVIPGSQIIFMPIPSFAHASMCAAIKDHVDDGAWVGVLPGQGGFQWVANSFFKESNVTLFGLDKLPYNCRTLEYAKRVKMFAYKDACGVACVPNNDNYVQVVAKVISSVVPHLNLKPIGNMLSVTLSPANQCIHPARMYGLFHESQTRDTLPLFYEEMDQLSADMIQGVSDEIQIIKNEFLRRYPGCELSVLDVGEALLAVYEVEDSSSLLQVFKTCKGFMGISTPMKERVDDKGEKQGGFEVDWTCRYFTEDVPTLVVLHAIGEMLQVQLPVIDKLIVWAQGNMGIKWLNDDGSLNTDYEAHPERKDCTPQRFGFQSADKLMEFHHSA